MRRGLSLTDASLDSWEWVHDELIPGGGQGGVLSGRELGILGKDPEHVGGLLPRTLTRTCTLC